MADDLLLSRLQFAFTAGSHYLFVVLTIGLATTLAVMQTRALFQSHDRREQTMRMVRFWGQLYVINYGMGIVTGLVMELQFGLGWSGLSQVASDVFGVPLAVETLVAFFLESTFLGLWIFGWGRLSHLAHTALIWGVTLTAYASAVFILVANGFLQRPTGVEMHEGTIRLVDFEAFLTNPAAWRALPHILFGSLLAGTVIAGLSAAQLRNRARLARRGPDEVAMLRRSLRWGMIICCIAIVPVGALGALQWGIVQPAKFAAWQGDYQTLATLQAEAERTFGPGIYTPPVGWVRGGAFTMLGCWGVMGVVAAISLIALVRRSGAGLDDPRLHRLLAWTTPLPFLAVLGGWTFREVGRQPWTIYGLLTTKDAVSSISHADRVLSFTAFTATFAALICLNWFLLLRQARRSHDTVSLGSGVLT